ncbi:luciferin 4-monooxygenase-like [Ostrinia nubilalis]|uniref:luciferin 4-monooxygenase-like n=1 Tax=Ostrinia nubilalis TaxID=29057 RepID=UPI0030824755
MEVSIHNNVVTGPEEEYIPAHLSYGQFMFDQIKRGGDNIALISGDTDESVTYRELLQSSVDLAVALQKLGLKKNDVVVVSSENRFEFMITALAVMFSGGVLSVFNITYTPEEINHLLNIVQPKYIFVSPIGAQNVYEACQEVTYVEKLIMFGEYEIVPSLMYKDLVKEHIDVDSFSLVDVNGREDSLAIMCSSGTTGLPKGVMLTHVNILTSTAHMKYYFHNSMKMTNHEIISGLSLIPWFHAYGFITTCTILALRIKSVFLTRFEPEQYLETIQKYKINMTTIVPPLAVFLAKDPLVLKYDLSSLNEVWCGAAPLSSDIQKAISGRTGLKYIKNGYGLTEVTMGCCVDLTGGDKVGSCGTPGPGIKIKVIDLETGQKLGPGKEGELYIKSAMRMKGYRGDVAASAALVDAEGYVRTGDVGYYDADGYIYIVDRLKELIKYNGFQVAPAELEAVLLRHGGVAECGVVGVPDARAGELPAAFVVRAPGSAVSEDELLRHVASKVSPTKYLRGGIRFIDEIPKTPAGKILRRELKKMLDIPKSKL